MMNVPYSALIAPDEINARAITKAGIDELAASIDAAGLIIALTVRPCGHDPKKFEVIDGRRRYLAIGKLIKTKRWKKDTEIPAHVINEDDSAALQASLIANTMRLPMHPVEQYEVFSRLADQGVAIEEMAARFGINTRTVKQQMALGKLAPEIRDAWKTGKIQADAAKAFTIAPDQAAQLRAFKKCQKQHTFYAHAIRQALLGDHADLDRTDAEVRKRYEAAGGEVIRDLFGDQVYVKDGELLEKVQAEYNAERSAELRAEVEAEGWAWIALSDDLPSSWHWTWKKQKPDPVFTAAELARVNEIEARLDELEDRSELSDEEGEEANALEAERDELHALGHLAAFAPEARAKLGVVLAQSYDGTIAITRGVEKPDDVDLPDGDGGDREYDADDDDAEHSTAASAEDEDGLHITEALKQTLSEQRTIAAGMALRADPMLAMRLVAAALISRFEGPSALRNEGHAVVRGDTDGPTFAQAFAQLLAADGETVQTRFAAAIATTLDMTHNRARYKSASFARDCMAVIGALSRVHYELAATKAFQAEDFFKRASKAIALAAIEDMREMTDTVVNTPTQLANLKKGDLVAIAIKLADETAWIPELLRNPTTIAADSREEKVA